MDTAKFKSTLYWVFGSLFLLAFGGVSALSLVGLRKGISSTAAELQQAEADLAQLQRQLSYLEAQIAQMHSPEFLAQRFGNSLKAPEVQKTLWVEAPAALPSRPVPPERFRYTLALRHP